MGILRAWRDAARVIDDARALVCLPCTGREGPCTCSRECGHPDCGGRR